MDHRAALSSLSFLALLLSIFAAFAAGEESWASFPVLQEKISFQRSEGEGQIVGVVGNAAEVVKPSEANYLKSSDEDGSWDRLELIKPAELSVTDAEGNVGHVSSVEAVVRSRTAEKAELQEGLHSATFRILLQTDIAAIEKEQTANKLQQAQAATHRAGKLLVESNGARLGGLRTSDGIEGDIVVSAFGWGAGLVDALVTSLSMIIVSEIGDETFIIAALMAMRHPRSIVLAGALSALGIMTVLSTGLGFIVPNLISRKATNSAATVLYTFFGLRLLYIAWKADPNDTPQKELDEVEEKLEGDAQGKVKSRTIRRLFARFCTPIFLEAFILTFLAEWGDRSQIATIALAAHKNPVGVTVGATLGHVVCTTLAVLGGRLLALRISQRTVATMGGLLFLVFAINSYINPPL